MRRLFFASALAILCLASEAQNKTNSQLRTLTKLTLDLQGVGISVEPRLSNSMTIDFSGGLGIGGYDISTNNIDYVVDPLNPTLFFAITPKFYYNLQKRLAKGKSGDLNSGNYFGLRIKYVSKGISENSDIRDALLFNVHWGLERAIAKRWAMNAHFGVGYAMDATDLNHTEGTIYPALDIRFAYILNKRR